LAERILVISVGATPQIVTETLHALATQPRPWWPDRLVLVTTSVGARIFRDGGGPRNLAPLLGAQGKLAALCRAIERIPPSVRIEIPSLAGAGPIADIRSDVETEAFADCALAVLRRYTANPDTQLHVSLAGGRKTMSALVCQALSLLGRAQDRLSHVLIDPPALENDPDFWWPEPGRQGAQEAVVRLHTLPFLRIGAWLQVERLLPPDATFQDAVASANAALQAEDLAIDLSGATITLAGNQLALPPSQLAVLSLAALATRRGASLKTVTGWNPSNRSLRGLALDGDTNRAVRLWAWLHAASQFNKIYRDAASVSFHRFDAKVESLAREFDYDTHVGPPLSRLRKRLRQHLPTRLAERILPKGSLRLALPDSGIVIHGPPDLHDHPDAPEELYPDAAS